MLSYFIRRELEQHTELAEGIDYPNLYTSALLVPVAIYVAALFSLATLRALKSYDVGTRFRYKDPAKVELAPKEAPKKRNFLPYIIGVILLSIYGLFIYARVVKNAAIIHAYVVVFTFVITLNGYKTVFTRLFCDMVVRREIQAGKAVPILKAASKDAYRSYWISLFSVFAAFITAYTGDGIAWNITLAFIVFYATSFNPPNRNGWTSVRGLIISILSWITITIAFLAIVFALLEAFGSGKDSPSDSRQQPDSSSQSNGPVRVTPTEFVSWGNSIFDCATGCLITILYRAECRLLSSSTLPKSDIEQLQWEHPPAPRSIPQKNHERTTETTKKPGYLTHLCLVDQTHLDTASSSQTTLHGVIIPRIITSPSLNPLTAPISTLALLTRIAINIPAILLSSDHQIFGLKYLLTAPETENSLARNIMTRGAILIHPSFYGLMVVPIVVTFACLLNWNGKGRKIWTYSEQWVLTKPEAFKADDEAQRGVDEAEIDEQATVLANVDVEDVEKVKG